MRELMKGFFGKSIKRNNAWISLWLGSGLRFSRWRALTHSEAEQLRLTERCTFEIGAFQVHFAEFGAIEHRAFELPAMKVECVILPIELFGIVDLERLVDVEPRMNALRTT